MNSNLEKLVEALRKRSEHTKTMPDYKVKTESEPLIVETLVKLSEEFEELRKRVEKIDDRTSTNPATKRVQNVQK
jgi:hypothetical protein